MTGACQTKQFFMPLHLFQQLTLAVCDFTAVAEPLCQLELRAPACKLPQLATATSSDSGGSSPHSFESRLLELEHRWQVFASHAQVSDLLEQTRSELVEALADVHWRLVFLTGQITVLRGQIESLRFLVASRSEDTDPALPRSFLDTLD